MVKALFLDRDGVINKDKDYVGTIDHFEFMPGIFELCKKALEKNYKLVIITNQSGVGRGYFTEKDYQTLTNWMLEQFKEEGINITAIYSCFSQDNNNPRRKPNPGMLLEAIEKYNLSPQKSIFIGDKETDMLAAKKAEIQTRIIFSNQQTSSATHHIQTLPEANIFLSK